jgi:hypothetical protein
MTKIGCFARRLQVSSEWTRIDEISDGMDFCEWPRNSSFFVDSGLLNGPSLFSPFLPCATMGPRMRGCLPCRPGLIGRLQNGTATSFPGTNHIGRSEPYGSKFHFWVSSITGDLWIFPLSMFSSVACFSVHLRLFRILNRTIRRRPPQD